MQELFLTSAHADDTGLGLLTGLTALCSLDLACCHNITDAGLKALVVPLSRHSLSHVNALDCRRLTLLSLVSSQRPFWQHGMSYYGIWLALLSGVPKPSIAMQEGRHLQSLVTCLCRLKTWVRSAAM